jgi:hypothetical protein
MTLIILEQSMGQIYLTKIIFYWADILACIPAGIFTCSVLEPCSAAYLVTVTSLAQNMVQFYVAVVPQTQDTWLASY